MQRCWCGNTGLNSFSPEYARCDVCGTLVFKEDVASGKLLVNDDESDFYGKQYWLKHQQDSFGYPGIHQRVRSDLTERNLHWLSTLLRYCRPPGKVMELGCSHGSFVALLEHAGFDAVGVEMSPWVVAFGRETFGVPIVQGPIESLDFPEASFDAIALMDVLEHLPDPRETMRHCLRYLKPDGLLLIQTPQFKQQMTFPSLLETQSRFLENLKPVEHLYLFSQESVTRLFHELGADHVRFEPAIFSHYDMFLAVSRAPLEPCSTEDADKALMTLPKSRLVLALLDLRRREEKLLDRNAELERVSASLDEQVRTLSGQLGESDTDRAARGEQIETLTAMLHKVEDDRAARGKQIESLTSMLHEAEDDRAARGKQIEILTARLKESEADRAARATQIEELTSLIRRAEEAPGRGEGAADAEQKSGER